VVYGTEGRLESELGTEEGNPKQKGVLEGSKVFARTVDSRPEGHQKRD
jgi:hypothetical protein